ENSENLYLSVLSFTYDAFGRIRTRTDTDGYVITYNYDAGDRVTRKTYPDGSARVYTCTLRVRDRIRPSGSLPSGNRRPTYRSARSGHQRGRGHRNAVVHWSSLSLKQRLSNEMFCAVKFGRSEGSIANTRKRFGWVATKSLSFVTTNRCRPSWRSG